MFLNRSERKKAAKQEFKKPVTAFYKIDLSIANFVPKVMTRAYRNTRYTVMVYDASPVTTGFATRVMIQRHDNKPIPNHWRELQNIKNELFNEEETAIEYYPPESKLIDDFNIYWLWIYEKGELPMPIL